jgi:hypothetical protein
MNPICKNPECNKEILTKTLLGGYNKHCCTKCRYSSSRRGKQYTEQPPSCFLGTCNRPVSWNKNKRVWNKYCCTEHGKEGRSIEVTKTKIEQNKLKLKIDTRQILKCSAPLCQNIAIKRNKKSVTHAYCCEKCRNIGLVLNQEKTFIKRLDVSRPSQSPESYEKGQKSGKRLREYIFKSGKIVYVRGYEPQALNLLENLGYSEQDLTVDVKEMPQFWYMIDDKKKRYYADIYIPAENKIIEVKSTYTYEKYIYKNMLKKRCVENMGIIFEFWIMDGKGNRLVEKSSI